MLAQSFVESISRFILANSDPFWNILQRRTSSGFILGNNNPLGPEAQSVAVCIADASAPIKSRNQEFLQRGKTLNFEGIELSGQFLFPPFMTYVCTR